LTLFASSTQSADAKSQCAPALELEIGVEVFRAVLGNEAILTIAISEECARQVVLNLTDP
jgi:hypothetical protein